MKRNFARCRFTLALILAGVSATSLPAADLVWTNLSGGSWATAANWKPAQVPTASDQVWITNSGTYTITITGARSAAGLALGGDSGTQTLSLGGGSFALNGPGVGNSNAVFSLAGGTLGGTGRLALAGPLNWSSGTITGAVQCVGGAISGNGCTLAGGQLVNAGVLVWTGGNLWLGGDAVISNLAGATFDLASDYGIVLSGTGGSGTIFNNGLLRKTGTNSFTYIDVGLLNTGTVLAETGILELHNTAANRGTNAATAPATLRFSGTSTHTLDAGSLVTGDGTVASVGFGAQGGIVVNGDCNLGGTFLHTGGSAIFNTPANVGALTLNGGFATLGGTGLVTVAGPLTWSAGTITGRVQCAGGVVSDGILSGGTLINQSLLTFTNSLSTGNGAVISNLYGAALELVGNWSLNHSGTGAKGTLFNAGALRKTTGTGASTINAILDHSGTAQLQSGTLRLLSGGTNSGSMSVAAGAVLSFDHDSVARNYWMQSGSSIDGAGFVTCTNSFTTVTVDGSFDLTGTNLLAGGTMNFNAAASAGALILSNGTLGGTGLVTVSGPLNWTAGTLAGSVQCAGGSISSTNRKFLTGGRLINSGLLTLSGTNLLTSSNSVISILPDATLNMITDLDIGAFGAAGTLLNAGTLRKSGGTSTARIYDTLHNIGTVQALRGTLTLNTTGTNGGEYYVAAPGVLNFGGSNMHRLDADSSLTGDGTIQCSGAGVEVNGTCVLTGTSLLTSGAMNFNLPATVGSLVITGANATLGGSALLTTTGPLNWTAGTITGAVQCAGGTIQGGFLYLTGGRLANAGSLRFLGGTIYTSAGSVISNLPGATLDAVWNYKAMPPPLAPNILHQQGGQFTEFHNAGLLRSAGVGIADVFHNSGTVQCTNGTLSLSGPTPAKQSGGAIQLLGGKMSASAGLWLAGGVLSGTNTFLGNLTNQATLRPGLSPGVLTIVSNYTELPGAVLEIELGGTTPGTGFDQLVVKGAAALAGALNVSLINGHVPPPGSSFHFLTAGALSGNFAATNLPTSLAGWSLDYASDGVTLRAPAISPTLGVTLGVSNAVVISWPWADAAWRLQASTNLTAGWEELPPPYATNAVGSYFIELAPAANRFFRLVR